MPVRFLILSLCVTLTLPAAMIEPSPVDPWASLRSAPPPEATPDPSDYPVPDLALELDQLLQFVLNWAYVGLENPEENQAILAALLPQYQAFLSSRNATAPPLQQVSASLSPLLQVQPLALTVGPATGFSSAPEPRTWLLLVAGLAVLLRRPLCRRG